MLLLRLHFTAACDFRIIKSITLIKIPHVMLILQLNSSRALFKQVPVQLDMQNTMPIVPMLTKICTPVQEIYAGIMLEIFKLKLLTRMLT